jgi:hypothetical protein
MSLPNNYRHGIIVNDNGTNKHIKSLFVNDSGAIKGVKEAYLNNDNSLVKIWPPRAYIVELVFLGANTTSWNFTAHGNTTTQNNGNAGKWNSGNWNAWWGGASSQSGDSNRTGHHFAFRRWDRYDSLGQYDFSQPNLVRKNASGAIQPATGGLYKNLLSTKQFDPSNPLTHSPFVVIEPLSKILAVRFFSYKTNSAGGSEGDSGPVNSVSYKTGNDTYFGSTTNTTWAVNNGESDSPPSNTTIAGATFLSTSTNGGVAPGRGSNTGKCGVGTALNLAGYNNPLLGWQSSINYSSTVTSRWYQHGRGSDSCGTVEGPLDLAPYTLPALTQAQIDAGHKGWKYFTMSWWDSGGANGQAFWNYWYAGGNTSLGSTLFLVIPP